MAHRKVIATQTGRYGTRMLTAGEEMILSGPSARAMIALGRAAEKPIRARRPQIVPTIQTGAGDDVVALRAEYREKLGRPPFNGWTAATLREKIAEA